MNRCLAPFVVGALFFSAVGETKADMIYNNAADFSTTTNPKGVWSYGEFAPGVTPVASTFTPYATPYVSDSLELWGQHSNPPPADLYNPTNMIINPSGVNPIQPGQAAFHPGPNGEYS